MSEGSSTGEFATDATFYRTIPLNTFGSDGTLRLKDARLTFVGSRDRVLFDAPVHELHSPELTQIYMVYLWHGDRRLRFVAGTHQVYTAEAPGAAGVVLHAAENRGAATAMLLAKIVGTQWVQLLGRVVGQPPPGLRIPRPWPRWVWLLGALLVTLAVIALIAAYTL